MGWDAFCSAKTNKKTGRLSSPRLRQIFSDAAKEVTKKGGTVDGSFESGALDCSDVAMMLERATGESPWVAAWTIEEVQHNWNLANWNFRYPKEDAWAYWSAKEFLRICAEENLSIKFSF